ncbi:vascular endothelial growth factor C-like [Pollicipes pollicipes]|uniref:LOW QUALITY PROTEIN: vascular endothelial growth factor C-like n=1 Tax=Pollicipes pollicipes TaxID=41117 RepID=UPI001884D8A1|nr:LOW QUALITY PROTEIN: vascular endothelial growth factor C-like [Pollicipes pollicipes]XP_037087299.1 vascular endothelial growth factor C-like [Pollicipes pollicipes]
MVRQFRTAAVVACVLVAAVVADPSLRRRGRFGSSSRRSSQAITFHDEFERANSVPGIPVSLAESLNKAESIRDLEPLIDRPSYMRYDVQSVARNAHVGGEDELSTRFGGSSNASGNKNGEMAMAALCQPELTTVPVMEDKGPNTIFWPSCTRVERCGGCCSHELLACKPTASKTIHVQVVRAEYEGGTSGIRYTGAEMVPLEVHTSCECGCRLSAQDCNRFQEYISSECRCKCVNEDDYYKCTKNDKKLWEPSTCMCKCKNERECSTGRYFDLNNCECRPLPSREDRPFDPVLGSRFYNPFRSFYSSDGTSSTTEDQQRARHADPARRDSRSGRTERPVRVRGPQRSNRYDERERRG